MMLPSLFIAPDAVRGRGVYTREALASGLVVEIAPVIVMSRQDRARLDQTLLHDYIFEWDPRQGQCAMALGYVPLYNHACPSNCEYEMEYPDSLIRIKTVRDIAAGEELCINYHGHFDDTRPLWFEVH